MNQHPYLRAYMAGIALPTAFLLVGLFIFCIAHFGYNVSAPIEKLIIFPMAVVPNVFGLWNMLFVKLHRHWRVPIGLHGAVLPFFLAPIGATLAISLGFLKLTQHGLTYFGIFTLPYWYVYLAPFLGIAVYYLAWKYVVGYLNQLLGIA